MIMPELPEVEVIRRDLAPLIGGRTFARPQIHFPTTIAHPAPEQFAGSLCGRQVESVRRRGKYLIIDLHRGILAAHLRMTGNIIYRDEVPKSEDRFLRLTLPFSDGSALYYSDMRRFGRLWLVENEEELEQIVLRRVGPDIYDDLKRTDFVRMIGCRPRACIKGLLLDQGFAAGMGNIYTDEALFLSGIDPRRRAGEITSAEAEKLYDSIITVLKQGIEFGGTTFRDYRNARGARGEFQDRLNIYGRRGERCRCGAVIEKTTVAGRSTCYCPCCQK
jgi:formamidopyrimidine-DNA glycosylase